MNIYLDSYLNNNLGDDLMISSICRRYPKHQFYVSNKCKLLDFACTEDNLHIIPLYNHFFVRIINKVISYLGFPKIEILREIIKKNRFDVYLALGGSIFMQLSKINWVYNVWATKFIMDRCDYSCIIGCNFGPYTSNSFKNKHLKLFSRCDSVTFRDKYSYDLFSELPNTRCYADILFHLQLPWIPRQEVGISVLSLRNKGILNHVETYIDGLIELIEQLRKTQKIVLLSFCENEGDLEACMTLKERLNPEGENIEIYNHKNVDNTLQRISHFSAMVCTRFHASVLAMDMGMPFLPITYSYKTDCMLNDAEYMGYRWDIRNGSSLDLQKALLNLNLSEGSIGHLKESAKGHFKEIDSLLCSSKEVYEEKSV